MPADADIYLPAVVPGAVEAKVAFVTGGHGVHHKQQEVGQLMCDAVTAQVMRQQEGGAKYRDVAMFIVCPTLCGLRRLTASPNSPPGVALRRQRRALALRSCRHWGPTLETWRIVSSSCKTGSADKARFKAMDERIKKEPATLFLVIQDEAHHSATFSGAANEFMNDSTVRTSPNVVILRVSATPYNLQTALAQTPLENEIHWGDRGSYYGINECTVTEALVGASASMRAVLQAMSVLCNPVVVDSTVDSTTIKQTHYSRAISLLRTRKQPHSAAAP